MVVIGYSTNVFFFLSMYINFKYLQMFILLEKFYVLLVIIIYDGKNIMYKVFVNKYTIFYFFGYWMNYEVSNKWFS